MWREIRREATRILYRGRGRYCPVCERSSRRFRRAGRRRRPDAKCPVCGSRERHRLGWIFLRDRTDLFDGNPRRMLHVAPTRAFAARLERVPGLEYVTADMRDGNVAVHADVTSLPFADDTFDVVYCAHVLEHVPDDRRAMREFRRVLAPHGWAVLTVPITADGTVEDPSVTDPRERERRFGQSDHVRRYGPDYVDRLEEAGFTVRRLRPLDVLGEPDERLGIPLEGPAGDIFLLHEVSR